MNRLKNVRSRWGDPLSRIGWANFETMLADYYRKQGYQVEHVGTGGTSARFDGGIDLKLRNDHEFIVVQCKHWNAKQVPHNDVHQLLGIMVNEGATGAILITSGEFTTYAKEAAAKQGHVQLIDGNALRAMIGPLPESHAVSSDSSDRVGAFASIVGERLLSAAEARVRGNRRHRSPYAPITQAILFLVVVIVVVVMMRIAINNALASLARPAPAQAVRIPVMQIPQAAPPQPYVSTSQPEVVAVRTPSGTRYETRFTPPTSDAGMKEWKRKNAESMKILEKTTPPLR